MHFSRKTQSLGSGQFGTVFKGTWKRSQKDNGINVAIKILQKGSQEKDKLRFLQEGAVHGQFHHPNVVKLYGMVTIGDPVSY